MVRGLTKKIAVIGLTGGIGSGKSTVARQFATLGVHWVDADDVARGVVAPGMPALALIGEHFGQDILNNDGALNRARLRQIVFEQPEQRAWLESLLHPIIREELVRQLHPLDYTLPYVLLVSPLLLETDQHQLAERVLVVDVPVEMQIARTVARDTNSREQVERIIAAQMPREQRVAKAYAVIDNNQPQSKVAAKVHALHKTLMEDFG
ncbi:hypothetical protein LCGC14_1780890 [marine sediment metagenome]|uniref:Dephospho-CoA kinase n=1 Tax=marine sediment metagenome TaxID=412755 RepID=A0A0F9JAF6_9ZZZZ